MYGLAHSHTLLPVEYRFAASRVSCACSKGDKQQLAVASAAATAGALAHTCAWGLSRQGSPDRNGSTTETILWDPEQQSSHSSPSLPDSDQPSPTHRTIHAAYAFTNDCGVTYYFWYGPTALASVQRTA